MDFDALGAVEAQARQCPRCWAFLGDEVYGGCPSCAVATTSAAANQDKEAWTVVHEVVYKRAEPSLRAEVMGLVPRGAQVKGTVVVAKDRTEWLKVGSGGGCSFMLIHGALLGLGILLERAKPTSEVALCVKSAASGDRLTEMRLPLATPVGTVKRRLMETCGIHVYVQQLLSGTRLLEDCVPLSELQPPGEVQLIRRPFNPAASSALLEHTSRLNVLAMVEALQAPAFPDVAREEDGSTPLMIAAWSGHVEAVQLLREAGADLQKANRSGARPVHTAAQKGHASVLRYLCQAKADVGSCTQSGTTPLYFAAWGGRFRAVRYLCEATADVNKANQHGATPLYIASQCGHLAVARFLCEARAELDTPKRGGATPLHISAQKGQEDVVRYLCSARADLDVRLTEADEGVAGEDAYLLSGATPLIVAAYLGHVMVTQCLIEFGADFDLTSNCGATALHLAMLKGLTDVQDVLLGEHGQ